MSYGIKVRATGLQDVQAYLGKTVARAKDLDPPLKKGGNIMLRSIDQNFKVAGRPKMWKPLSTAYGVRKLKSGYSPLPLTRTGQLRRSITFRVRGRKLSVGTSVPYAPYHQFGTRRMPSRPYLIFQNEDIRRIEQLIVQHIVKGGV
jgi:phage virion morphogenesis protein